MDIHEALANCTVVLGVLVVLAVYIARSLFDKSVCFSHHAVTVGYTIILIGYVLHLPQSVLVIQTQIA